MSEMRRRPSAALSSLLTAGETATLELSLEAKLLCAFVVLLLFLLFLITVLWDRYGKEIGELYTPGGRSTNGDVNGTLCCLSGLSLAPCLDLTIADHG